jgi:hypothetical protein
MAENSRSKTPDEYVFWIISLCQSPNTHLKKVFGKYERKEKVAGVSFYSDFVTSSAGMTVGWPINFHLVRA